VRRLLPLVLLFVAWVPAAHAWTWPVDGPVEQGFAFDSTHPYAGGQHRGIDIGSEAGATVVAPAAGTVAFAGSVPTNGLTVTIETGDGLAVTLTHLGSLAVARGAAVAEGDAIGALGPTGTPEVEGPYVHLGIRLAADPNGYLDPLSLLPPPAGPSEPVQGPVTASPPAASSGDDASAPAGSDPAAQAPATGSGESAPSGADVTPATAPAPAEAAPPEATAGATPAADAVAPSAVTADAAGQVRPGASSTDTAPRVDLGAGLPAGSVASGVRASSGAASASGQAAPQMPAQAPVPTSPVVALAPARHGSKPAPTARVRTTRPVARSTRQSRRAPRGEPAAPALHRPARPRHVAVPSTRPEVAPSSQARRAASPAVEPSVLHRRWAIARRGVTSAEQIGRPAGLPLSPGRIALVVLAFGLGGIAILLARIRRRRSSEAPDPAAVVIAFPGADRGGAGAGSDSLAA
jgi:Peptidase family M23